MPAKKQSEKMSSDIIAEIERGRKVGYPDKLIRNSLEVEGYSPDSIKQAFNEIEKRKKGNGSSNGNGFMIKTHSIKRDEKKKGKTPDESPVRTKASGKKHWLMVAAEILFGIILFAIIGILIYLFLVPAVVNS